MANANIKYLTDENKNVVSPVTSSKSVFLTDNTALQDKINSVDNNISTINSKLINATTSTAGFMSAADKTKLDGIATGANNVSVSRSLTSGTKVGTITINGAGTDLYAPVLSSSSFMIKTHTVSATEDLAAGDGMNFYPELSNSGHYPLTIASLPYDASEGGFEYSFTRLYNRTTGKCNLAWYCKNAYNGAKKRVSVKIDILWLKV